MRKESIEASKRGRKRCRRFSLRYKRGGLAVITGPALEQPREFFSIGAAKAWLADSFPGAVLYVHQISDHQVQMLGRVCNVGR